MIFKTDVVLLKSENRPFTDSEGKKVEWSVAKVLDSYGNVFDANAKAEAFKSIEGMVNVPGIAEFELFKGRNKDGKDSLKLRLRSFTRVTK